MRAVTARFLRCLPLLLAAVAVSLAQTAIVDRVAASVNGAAIPESAVRRAMVLSPLAREAGESPEAFRARVLEALIDQNLQYEDALRFGPSPPDASEIEAAMAKLRERLAQAGTEPGAEFARAGMTAEDVRASVERQLVVQRYLRERFRTAVVTDEESARAEYGERYAPERRGAGLPVPPFEKVAEEMRVRAQQRGFDAEVEKWIKELREKAKITVYPAPAAPAGLGAPVVISTAPAGTRTPAPSN